MLERLIDLSLRHRVLVLVATGLLVVTGLLALKELPFDAFPDTTPVQVTVNTVAPAYTPLEIERQVTLPLEQGLGGLPDLTEMRSISKFGFSQITLVFEEGSDVWRARQAVGERLGATELPEGVGRPALGPVSTGLGEVFQYLVTSETLSPTELRTLHHWVVRPQMLQVPGVAEINTWGGYEKEIHVVVDPDRLLGWNLGLDDLAHALQRNNRAVGGGLVSRGGEAKGVQGLGLLTGPADVAEVVVASVDGVPVTVGDVARVEEGHEVRRGAVTAEGEGEAVLGLGFMLMGENSRELTRRLEARLAEVQERMPDGLRLEPVYSRTQLVEQVLETVRENLFEGALLVIAVLFVLMGDLRAGIIVALAIPLSMLFAFNAMLRFGIAGTLMSLGAIDFGLVVDSSVIMVENASRRLEEDTTGRSIRDIVRDAAVEVRRPTLFGELIIAVVYLPILALEGAEGALFRPMALTVLFALGGSMILSMTLMPVLASMFLRRRSTGRRARSGPNRLVRGMQRAYRPMLEWALRRRAWVLAGAGLLVVNAAVLAFTLGTEFVPRLREQALVINTVRLAGVSLDESVRYGSRIEQLLKERFPDEIAHVWTRTGTAEVATDPMGLEVSDVFLTLTPRDRWTKARTQDELTAAVRETMEGLPGMRSVSTQPIEMRVNEMDAGVRADVGVKLFGEDYDVLAEKAEELRAAVASVPGAADVTVEQLTGAPTLRVELDRRAVARHGLDADSVLGVVAALGGRRVGEVVEGERRFALDLVLDESYRSDPARLGRVLVLGPEGQRIPLSQLTTIETVEGPSTVQREWGRRRVIVQANVADRDLGSFVADVRTAVSGIELPEGWYVRLGGQFEHLERARRRLLIVVPVALALILVLLQVTYGRWTDALRVFTGVPFAAVGGIAALWLRGMPFSVSAGVGFVALSGVAVLGDMVLVSQVRRLMAEGVPGLTAIREAATTRLRPVLMTALVAALGFVPMALNTGVGAEVQRPLATVVIGGLFTSTLATLVVLPVLYAVFGAGGAGGAEVREVVEGAPTGAAA